MSALPCAWPLHEVGRNGDTFDPLAGPLLQANTVIFSPTLHMHSTGKDTTGHLELGFRFHEKGYEPEHRERLSARWRQPGYQHNTKPRRSDNSCLRVSIEAHEDCPL
ncbi:MAG: hypothetical protein ACJ0S4_00825 [Candidatus Rariloculaceae bacterium]